MQIKLAIKWHNIQYTKKRTFKWVLKKDTRGKWTKTWTNEGREEGKKREERKEEEEREEGEMEGGRQRDRQRNRYKNSDKHVKRSRSAHAQVEMRTSL